MAKLIFPSAAAVDISSKDHFACVPIPDSDYGEVRQFGCYTKDLHEIANWFKEHKIKTVAMESTGIYFLELYKVLMDYGFEVVVVNAAHAKNVPGRPKTDVKDAQWLQRLHSFGLLRGCYQPDNEFRTLRTYVRERKKLTEMMTTATNRMLKSLEMMNIKTKMVISDIHGKTGTAVINAILKGERNPHKLLQHKDRRIKASNEEFVLALEGNWKDEQLYILNQQYKTYIFFNEQRQQLDLRIEKTLILLSDSIGRQVNVVKDLETKRSAKSKTSPDFDVQKYLKGILGIDPTEIYGVRESSALTILSETGYDLKSKYPSVKHFVSWLNLVPDSKISGGKVISQKMKKRKNKAGQAFRQAASTLWRSKNPLADKLRSKKAKKGAGPAIIGIAKTLATIYYNMVVKQEEFDPSKVLKDNSERLKSKILYFEKKAQEMRKLYESGNLTFS